MGKNKLALITGANKGIGFESSRQLGKLGYKVILGARNVDSGKTAVKSLKNEGIDTQLLLLDVTNQDTIDNAVKFIEKEHGFLDILINNEGVFLEKGVLPSQLKMKALKETFDVNFFGIFAMTAAFLP